MSERDRAALQQLFDLITNIHRGELAPELTDNVRRALISSATQIPVYRGSLA